MEIVDGVEIPDYLVRVVPGELCDSLLSCDIVGCFATEIDWILNQGREDLVPIYRDIRPEFDPYNICLDCIRAGRHMEDRS